MASENMQTRVLIVLIQNFSNEVEYNDVMCSLMYRRKHAKKRPVISFILTFSLLRTY